MNDSRAQALLQLPGEGRLLMGLRRPHGGDDGRLGVSADLKPVGDRDVCFVQVVCGLCRSRFRAYIRASLSARARASLDLGENSSGFFPNSEMAETF